MPMLVECKLLRKGGTIVPMPRIGAPDAIYHFTGSEKGPHVAEVEDEDHLARFLAIPDGYRVARPTGAGFSLPAAAVALGDKAIDDPKAVADPLDEAVVSLATENATLKAMLAELMAAKAEPVAATEPVEPDAEPVDPVEPIAPPAEPDPELEAARDEFKALFDREPNPRTSLAKLRERIAEAKAAAGTQE